MIGSKSCELTSEVLIGKTFQYLKSIASIMRPKSAHFATIFCLGLRICESDRAVVKMLNGCSGGIFMISRAASVRRLLLDFTIDSEVYGPCVFILTWARDSI